MVMLKQLPLSVMTCLLILGLLSEYIRDIRTCSIRPMFCLCSLKHFWSSPIEYQECAGMPEYINMTMFRHLYMHLDISNLTYYLTIQSSLE